MKVYSVANRYHMLNIKFNEQDIYHLFGKTEPFGQYVLLWGDFKNGVNVKADGLHHRSAKIDKTVRRLKISKHIIVGYYFVSVRSTFLMLDEYNFHPINLDCKYTKGLIVGTYSNELEYKKTRFSKDANPTLEQCISIINQALKNNPNLYVQIGSRLSKTFQLTAK